MKIDGTKANKNIVWLSRGIITSIIAITTVASIAIHNDNKYNSEYSEIIKNKNEVVQLNITPNTGVYAGKYGYVYNQIDNIISKVSKEYNIEEWKVNVLVRELNIEPIYSDKSANIYTDLSVEELIDGNLFTVEKFSNLSENSSDTGGENTGNRKSFVDVIYSLVKEYVEFEGRSVDNIDFVNNDPRIKYLTDEDKSYIKFGLDVLDFIGKSEYKDKFCSDYKNIIDTVQKNNITTKVIYVDNRNDVKLNGIIEDSVVMTSDLDRLWSNNSGEGSNTEETSVNSVDVMDDYVDTLAKILSGSNQFTSHTTFFKNYEEPTVPVTNASTENDSVTIENKNNQFNYLELTRRNMMVAATSLVGKVRYIWGGGHGGGAQIAGANPMWEKFNSLYSRVGIDGCLESSSGNCPIHGYGACAYSGPSVNTVDEYVQSWKEQMDKYGFEDITSDIDAEKMYSVFRDRNTVSEYESQSLGLHQLDGLDCSGYVCWVYNQVDSYDTKDTVAVSFVNTDGVKRVALGDKLYPGDAIGWDTHIVLVFGEFNKDCYIVVEQTPDVLRFGAVSVGEGSQYLDDAVAYANELNAMAGIDTENNKAVARQLENYNHRSLGIARLDRPFDDEGVVIDKYGKAFEELNAQEIVEYIGYGK